MKCVDLEEKVIARFYDDEHEEFVETDTTVEDVLHVVACDDYTVIEVEPVEHGEWIDYSAEGYVECPFCGNATNCDGNIEDLHFCFSCGAKLSPVRKEE